jgi:hypothetical protein
MQVDNVPADYLLFHLFFTWVISFIVLSTLIRYNRNFVNLKLQYDEYALKMTKMKKIEMRSIIVAWN